MQLAVGGNDNSCTLWIVKDILSPKLAHILPHKAAVKAVAFCPWSKSLLVTGGGSKDRKIKFWHTVTGTLIREIQTAGQVTSLLWSVRYKQLMATFGFGDIENPMLLTVFSYPQLSEKLHVRSPTPLRVLSAVPSPRFNAICVATNDETIRFYEIWKEVESPIVEAQECQLYNSKLIDFIEGITSTSENIIR
ncbi:Meiosis-specific APC/C activator protein AMA1 [Nakaseomyces bracarensis]|uniref:Meiosis-specific APC/C activator protein AMA1 n=1 Tax=Nakaseomyces bracarensis TaxID=273131 RepID=A0ABR4NR03_9SACH